MKRRCANHMEEISDQFHAKETLPTSRRRVFLDNLSDWKKEEEHVDVTLTNLIGFASCWTGSLSSHSFTG